MPRDDVGPQGVVERQETISTYLLRRAKRRREAFLRRSETFSMRAELLRALYLVGCLLFDFLVIPESIFLLPGAAGWGLMVAGFVIAAWLEVRFYTDHFALQDAPGAKP